MRLTFRNANKVITPELESPLLQYDGLAYKASTRALLPVSPHARWEVTDMTIKENQAEAYKRLSWITTAVRTVAQYGATTPFQVFALKGEDKEGIKNHPFELLLNRPNPRTSRFQLIEQLIAFRLLCGESYLWLNKSTENAPPVEVYSIPPYRMSVIPGADIGGVRGYEWDAGMGKTVTLEPWEVVHFRNFNPTNMWSGMSFVEPLAPEIEADTAAARYDAAFFSKDYAKPEGILGVDGLDYNSEERKALENRFTRKHGGTKRSLAIMGSAEGLKYIALAPNYTDMNFIANRQFKRDEIYDHFAPGLASWLSMSATEASSKTGQNAFLELGVHPQLVAIQEDISNSILPLYGEKLVGEFDDVRIRDAALELQQIAEYARYHTINEVREEYYNIDPLDDERGEMLVIQISPTTTLPEITSIEPEPVPPQLLGTNPPTPPQEEDNDMPEPSIEGATNENTTAKASAPDSGTLLRSEVKQYIHYLKSRIKRGRAYKSLFEFEADNIPATLKAAIAGALDVAETMDDKLLILEGVVANA